jgi:threonine/homoserine/homoserine lactone efflux protein
MVYLFQGLLIGIAIAAPVGPIGVLCIQRTLAHGRRSGFVTGLGAATADGAYGAVAAFGLTGISYFLAAEQTFIRAIGGIFLAYLAVITLRAGNAQQPVAAERNGIVSDYFSTLLLTIANPATIISFIAVFAAAGFGAVNGDLRNASLLVLGVFSGSALWWLILSFGTGFVASSANTRSLRIANLLSGAILLLFAAYALVTSARSVV